MCAVSWNTAVGVSSSVVPNSATSWTVAHGRLCPWDFPGKNTGVGCHSLLRGDLPDPGIEPASRWQVDSLPPGHQGSPPVWWCPLLTEYWIYARHPPGLILPAHLYRGLVLAPFPRHGPPPGTRWCLLSRPPPPTPIWKEKVSEQQIVLTRMESTRVGDPPACFLLIPLPKEHTPSGKIKQRQKKYNNSTPLPAACPWPPPPSFKSPLAIYSGL